MKESVAIVVIQVALASLAFFATDSASQGRLVVWKDLDMTGEFRIEPDLIECKRVERDCSGPTYEGGIRFIASTSDNGRLVDFRILVNDKQLPLDVVDRYGDELNFGLGNFHFTYSPVYLPRTIRREYVGVPDPYLEVHGLSILDDSCEFKIREIRILYLFESEDVEVTDSCHMP